MLQVHFAGTLPTHFDAAFEALCADLSMVRTAQGMPVHVRRATQLELHLHDEQASIGYAQDVELYRALSLLSQHAQDGSCQIREKPAFAHVGAMFDVSRNAVYTLDTVRFLLRKMALMGMNLCAMYTEDTFEVEGYPYIGHLRGRYTQQELRELDDYAHMLGIEMFPCIQTLGHLNRVLHWPAMAHLKDTEEILLVDEPETYALIEALLRSACAPYRSRRVQIGMDETHGLGLGAFLRKHGYEPGASIIRRHLERVRQIATTQGLSCIMWSDMYFRLCSPTGGYYDCPEMPPEVVASAPDDVTLMYWDYYHESEAEYATMFQKHAAFSAPTAFAGGIWTWTGPAPDYEKTIRTALPGLAQAEVWGVNMVLAAAWGDNGAEANVLTILLGLQIYAEYTYAHAYDPPQVAERFSACCGASMQAFLDLTQLNAVPGVRSGALRPANTHKFMLYQDPLVQLYEKDMEGIDAASHYATLAQDFSAQAAAYPAYELLFHFYAQLAQTLAGKCDWHRRAGPCVRREDRAQAVELAALALRVAEEIEALRLLWQKLWFSTNKPFGFEIIELRLGGLCARMRSAAARMQDFADRSIDSIEELSAEPLPYIIRPDGTLFGSYAWNEIVSACKIDI